MSGTSCDGIDAVALQVAGERELTVVAHVHDDYEPEFRERLLGAAELRAEGLARLHVQLGQRFGAAAERARAAARWECASVAAVVCAGHTIAHLPPAEGDPGATLALGDGDVIAQVSGCAVLCDLRAADRAAGGHGAPLVPFADALLLRAAGRVRGALNLGGIANITLVPPEGDPVAFDTGPGNMLIDAALARATGGGTRFDRDGALGLSGRADEALVARLVASDAFLAQRPPRSTGRERYGAAWLHARRDELSRLSLPDLVATLAGFTVACIAHALEHHVRERPDELVVSGGGALNGALMAGLARRLSPIAIARSDEALGIPVLAKEAVAFALLGDATLAGRPCNVPSVTGARRPALLGKLCAAPRR